MNKKIKVIELINKIYENLDVPKRVKLNTYTFEYCEEEQDFYDKKHSTFLICDYAQSHSKWLEVEVEILEDEEEIDIKIFEEEWLDEHKLNMQAFDLDLVFKINEVIDKVNKLDKKINKE